MTLRTRRFWTIVVVSVTALSVLNLFWVSEEFSKCGIVPSPMQHHTLSHTFTLSHGEQRGRCLCYGLTEALISFSQSFQITYEFSRVKRRERPSSSV